MLTDTHCHLADPALASRLPEITAAAHAAGVRRFMVPSVTEADFDAVCRLHNPPEYYGALGLHPWFAESFQPGLIGCIAERLQAQPGLLVGEIGLDYYGDRKQTRAAQTAALLAQLDLAQQFGRPVLLHHVRAAADVVAALKHSGFCSGGIAHAFSGSLEEARAFIRCGLLIGIGTLVLNSNARKVRTGTLGAGNRQPVYANSRHRRKHARQCAAGGRNRGSLARHQHAGSSRRHRAKREPAAVFFLS